MLAKCSNAAYEITNVRVKNLFFTLFGTGEIDLIIEMGLGSCIGEWWHIAEKLSKTYTVLLYERAGNGMSDLSKNQRTPYFIANELHQLLSYLPHKRQVTILAHSQGGLYAQQYTRLFPNNVKKLMLLDPLSAYDNRFQTELSKKEYKKSGVNKTGGLYINLLLAKMHFGSMIKKIMLNAPPFYYYNDFSNDQKDYMLNCFIQQKIYKTAIEEYLLSHHEEVLTELKESKGFPQIPLYLITHSSEIAVDDMMQFGGLSLQEAQKIERIWQTTMQEYLLFSKHSVMLQAKYSGHYIHLTDLDLICKVLED